MSPRLRGEILQNKNRKLPMPKVLISDNLSQRAVEIFKQNGIDVDFKAGIKKEELLSIIAGYDGLAIRSETKATKDLIDAATNLKVIGRAGIGVDNVDVPTATTRGIVVMNTPFGNSTTTAEHALSMMMALARQIPTANASTHAGKWEKSKFMGVELCGKTLAVIGCGNIGSIVANRALGLQMRVVAYDPFLTAERAESMGVVKMELDAALAIADFITLHTPLTDSTKYIINEPRMAAMKKGVRIINCARGGLVDEKALKAAIESGHVAGAALDVFEVEPAKENILFGMEKVVLTPHLGASTSEAQENVAVQIAEQISAYLIRGEIMNAVNIPSITARESAELKPHMLLATLLGLLAGQLVESAIRTITLEFDGQIAKLNTKPIHSILLQGILASHDENVNMVNAIHLAKERGISVGETKFDRDSNYKTMITLRVTTDKQSYVFSGTLFDGDKPRIVEANGIKLEAALSPIMLYTVNDDKPGFIGSLGRILGEANINIAHFHLGRNNAKTEAISMVSVDNLIPIDVLKKIQSLGGVQRAVALLFQ